MSANLVHQRRVIAGFDTLRCAKSRYAFDPLIEVKIGEHFVDVQPRTFPP